MNELATVEESSIAVRKLTALQNQQFPCCFFRVSLKKRSEIVEDFNTNPNGVQVGVFTCIVISDTLMPQ